MAPRHGEAPGAGSRGHKAATPIRDARRAYHGRHLDARAVKDAARGRELEILAALVPGMRPAIERLGRHGPCPRCGGKDRFRVFPDASGGTYCNGCGPCGNLFATLQEHLDVSFPEAVEAVAGALGLDGRTAPPWRGPTPARPKAPPKPDPAKVARLRRLWRESEPLRAGDPVARYLEGRGLDLRGLAADVLRAHPELDYWADGTVARQWPAMLARVTGPDGAAVAIHTTYLDPDRPGRKAPVPSPRKLWTTHPGATRGAAVRLYPLDGPRLAVAEGVETAVAVHQISGVPCWSAISAGGLERVVLPSTVPEVIVCADHDESSAGQRAAEKLAGRLTLEGQAIRIATPPRLGDWCDVLAEGGAL